MDRVREAIAPYTRFVRSQYDHLELMRTELTAVDNDMRALRHRIGDERTLPEGERARALTGVARDSTPRRFPEPEAEAVIDAEVVEAPRRLGESTGAPRADGIDDPQGPEDI
jgi:hypothetical protein